MVTNEEDDNAILGFLRKNRGKKVESLDKDEEADVDYIRDDEFSKQSNGTNNEDPNGSDIDEMGAMSSRGIAVGDPDVMATDDAIRIERLVEDSERKRSYVKQMIAEMNQGGEGGIVSP